jgi:hypothetical protein
LWISNGLEAFDLVSCLPIYGISFGSDLLTERAKLSAIPFPKIGMVWHQWFSRTQQHDATLLFTPIWKISNGLEATDLVS